MTMRTAKRIVAVGMVLFAGACGGAQKAPADAQTTVVSLEKIDCADCGEQMVADLRSRPGVYEASFDKRRAEISVLASPSFDVFTTVKKLAANEGFQAILGAGKGAYADWGQFPEGADVQIVARDGQDLPS